MPPSSSSPDAATPTTIRAALGGVAERLAEAGIAEPMVDAELLLGHVLELSRGAIQAAGLNADWVVLSACNTIAGDKPGAEALSGLARAFFYAGARALLASHWPVRDGATSAAGPSTAMIIQRP